VVKGRLRGWGVILAVGLVVALASALVGACDKVANRAEAPTNKVTATITVGNIPIGVAAAEGAVWVTNSVGLGGPASVSRIDPATNKVTATIKVSGRPAEVAAAEGAVWAVNNDVNGSGSVSRIDPATNKVTATITVGHLPFGIATAEGAVWVANNVDGSVSRIE
jgi:virginiamycin B lyase